MLVLWRVTQLYIICPTIVPYVPFLTRERERESKFLPSKKRYRFKFGCMFLKGQILPIKLLIYVYLEPFDDPAVLIGISTCFFLEGEKPLRWRTNRFHVYRYNIYIYIIYTYIYCISAWVEVIIEEQKCGWHLWPVGFLTKWAYPKIGSRWFKVTFLGWLSDPFKG